MTYTNNKVIQTRCNLFGIGIVEHIGRQQFRMEWVPSQLSDSDGKLSEHELIMFDCIERASVRLDEIIRLARWKSQHSNVVFILSSN